LKADQARIESALQNLTDSRERDHQPAERRASPQ
jgi:hypothetical protein